MRKDFVRGYTREMEREAYSASQELARKHIESFVAELVDSKKSNIAEATIDALLSKGAKKNDKT